MKILFLKLVNFIGVKAATGLNEIEFRYDKITQPIIQLYGKNRCGKTVMIQQHHPFSSINLTGDERNDLDLVLPGEVGYKNIVYEVGDKVYDILHTYKPTSKSHTVSTSIKLDGKELNPSGGVTTGMMLIEKHLGINKYVFQFIINGTNLTSFSGMGSTQRKTLLNKAMGIDIYDKIHKLATDDYRFTNKLITSLNHTKEYLLATYGSYETLFATVDAKRSERMKMEFEIQQMKSKMDQLNGMIQTINQQHPTNEMYSVQSSIDEYQQIMSKFNGVFDPTLPDQLVETQIQLNQQLSELKATRSIILKELDDLYAKKNLIQENNISVKQSIDDKDRMQHTIQELTDQIDQITYDHVVDDMTYSYLLSMLTLSQAINSTCKEVVSSLKHEHLEMMVDMLDHGIDVSAFLITEGVSAMDAEKEKSIITRIKSMMNSVDGEIPDQTQCTIQNNCLYRRVYDAFDSYFKSYQSTQKGSFTQYDLEQFDHAYKNIQTIKRLISVEIPNKTLQHVFSMHSILHTMLQSPFGVDVDFIKHLMEESAKMETRTRYIKQLNDCQQTLQLIEARLSDKSSIESTDMISNEIQTKNDLLRKTDDDISNLTQQLSNVDEQRTMLSSVKRIDIHALQQRRDQLQQTITQLSAAESEYTTLNVQYQQRSSQYRTLMNELDVLEKAFDQYVKTSTEIEQHTSMDETYRAIAEATSSTKGIPVIAIRDTVHRAIYTANQLLDVMYDHEIELLQPIIDETHFSLPFRCGTNHSDDIRYGSQSESTLLSLALSLSLASSLTKFNIPLVDEIDAYLDMSIRDDFILMLESMMGKLGMEQMFLISHNLQKGQFSHIVKTIDISEIIDHMKGGD